MESFTLTKGRNGLVFQRNMIASLGDYGTQISKDFEEKTGIPVKCEFVSRAVGVMKLRFSPMRPLEKGAIHFNKEIKKYVKDNMKVLNTYLTKAIKNTLGNSTMVEIDTIDKEKGTSSQWMGDKVDGDRGKNDKGDLAAGNAWVGTSSK